MKRAELVNQAVVEAARAFMAATLVAERANARPSVDDALMNALMAQQDALQELRDALSAQSRVRARAALGGGR